MDLRMNLRTFSQRRTSAILTGSSRPSSSRFSFISFTRYQRSSATRSSSQAAISWVRRIRVLAGVSERTDDAAALVERECSEEVENGSLLVIGILQGCDIRCLATKGGTDGRSQGFRR